MQPPKPEGRPHGENLYYLGVNDEHERRFVEAWLEKNRPNTRAKYVTELRLARLTEQHTVRVLMRTGRKVSQALPMVKNEHGIKEIVQTDADKLAEEVSECASVHCRDFWVEDGSEGAEGELNTSRFLEAVGKTCIPACIKWRPDQGVLRLMWA
jgi:hypothetical protein